MKSKIATSNSDVIKSWSDVPQSDIENFGDEGDLGRQLLLNPTIFKLLGDVNGKLVLDAGCGNGYLSRLLAKQGAKVTGVEPAEGFYHYAVRREEGEKFGIVYHQADLSEFTEYNNYFDIEVANMVFMDIPDYESAMHNCILALKRGGQFVFSLLHPCFENSSLEWQGSKSITVKEYINYYERKQTFGSSFHRPLSEYLNFVINAGCTIVEVVEPAIPIENDVPPEYEKDKYIPSFIVISAIKNS